MAWSAKLQSGSGGVQGYNEWQLYFNASTQTVYKVTYQLQLGDEAPDVLYHTPDNGSPIPVRATGRNRVIFLEMHITGQSSWDNVLNAIAPISRLVNGPDSQAVRASTTGAAENVRVAIQPDGATAVTYFDVLHGFVDTSTAFTSPAAVLNTAAYKVVIALTCKPYGYGAGFTLRNDLPSSPHFIEGSTAGLADGWALVGTPAVGISATTWLVGGKAQAVTGDTNEGIISPAITSSPGTCAAFVWVMPVDNPIQIDLISTAGSEGTKTLTATDTNGISDKSAIGSDGNKWWRVPFSVTAAGSNLQIRAVATEASTNFFLDVQYIQAGTLTIPGGWCSSSSLKNRYDPVVTTAATRQQINYLDVWGIPGDLPAIIQLAIDSSITTPNLTYATRSNFSKTLPSQYQHIFDDTGLLNGDNTGASLWSSNVDATALGGNYLSTGTGAIWGLTPFFSIDFDSATMKLIHSRPCRFFARCRKVGVDTITVADGGSTSNMTGVFDTSGSVIGTNNVWLFIDLGLWIPNKNIYDLTSTFIGSINFFVTSSGTATDFQIDAIWAMPFDGELLISDSTYDLTIDGVIEEISNAAFRRLYPKKTGSLWSLLPKEENRITIAKAATAQDMSMAEEMSTVLTVTPRTSHLLGTA